MALNGTEKNGHTGLTLTVLGCGTSILLELMYSTRGIN